MLAYSPILGTGISRFWPPGTVEQGLTDTGSHAGLTTPWDSSSWRVKLHIHTSYIHTYAYTVSGGTTSQQGYQLAIHSQVSPEMQSLASFSPTGGYNELKPWLQWRDWWDFSISFTCIYHALTVLNIRIIGHFAHPRLADRLYRLTGCTVVPPDWVYHQISTVCMYLWRERQGRMPLNLEVCSKLAMQTPCRESIPSGS